MNFAKQEIRKALLNPSFFIAILMQIIFLYVGGWEDWPWRDQLDSFYMFANSRELGVAHLFLPILSCLPYAMSYVFENKSRYFLFQYHRTENRSWILGKIIAVTLAGGLAVGLGTLIYAIFCILLVPSDSLIVEVWRTYADGHWLEPFLRNHYGIPYLFLCVFVDTVAGCVWSCIGLLCAVALNNVVLVLLVPEFLYLLCSRIDFITQVYDSVAMSRLSFYSDAFALPRIILCQTIVFIIAFSATLLLMLLRLKDVGLYSHRVHDDQDKGLLNRVCTFLKVSPPMLVFFAICLLLRPILCFGNTTSFGTMLLSLAGGIEYQEQPVVRDLAQWMIFLLPCFIHTGMILSQEFADRIYIKLYRYEQPRKWCVRIMCSTLIPCILYVLLALLWIMLYSHLLGVRTWLTIGWSESGEMIDMMPYIYWLIPTLCCHIATICILQICATIYIRHVTFATCIVLTLVMSTSWLVTTPSRYAAYAIGNMGMIMRLDPAGVDAATPQAILLTQLGIICMSVVLIFHGIKRYRRLNFVR